jgi:catechol 2,3-dioxygenase-like lactoylglutathione lyase family enzyme
MIRFLHTRIRVKSLEASIAFYQKLGYTVGEPAAVEYDEKRSIEWYNTLIAKHPKSPFLAQAHFRVAQYHFDFNELPQAQANYSRAVEIEGLEGSLYGPSLYKLAWTNYRLNNYDVALDELNALLPPPRRTLHPGT